MIILFQQINFFASYISDLPDMDGRSLLWLGWM